MLHRGHPKAKSPNVKPSGFWNRQIDDLDDGYRGEYNNNSDVESSNSEGESSGCETGSEAESNPKTEAVVAKRPRRELFHELPKVDDPNTNVTYIEKLESDNLRLTQQLRALQSRDKQVQEPAASLQVEEKPVEIELIQERTRDAEVPDTHDTSNQEREPVVEVDCPSLEILRYKKNERKHGGHKFVRDSDRIDPEDRVKNLAGKHVLKVDREFDVNKTYLRTSIEIFSPNLQRFLDKVPGFMARMYPVDDVYCLTEPFLDLFLNRKALTDVVENQNDGCNEKDLSQARSHIQLVLDFLRSDFGDLSRKLDDLDSDIPSTSITYPELFLLYKPGTIVYSTKNGEHEAFVVDSVRGMNKRQKSRSRQSGYSRLDLTCWSINFDGEVFGRVWSMHCIASFDGTREISSLSVVPEKFLPNAAEVQQSLLARGQKFWSLQGQQCREYTGELYSQRSKEEATRVVVDHLTYQRRNHWPISINQKRGPSDALNKNWKDDRFDRRRGRFHDDEDSNWDFDGRGSPAENVSEEYYDERRADTIPYRRYDFQHPPLPLVSKYEKYDLLEAAAQLDELALLVCPQHVHGYCLREKKWKNLNINQLRPVLYREDAWSRLVLDAEYKSIVRAMVSSYVSKSAPIDDLVAGKGSGLVALLHGPPGSGKTLTAECVAESFHKPLYQVTCGDIGTDPEELESRLEEIFDYSTTWGAILLLDEADIFLQDRDYASLERNALVSIFLRTLDYFSGILFLTTNRVGSFDQAFQSRIHVTLGLPVLDQSRRIAVWNIFIDDLAKKNGYPAEEHDRLRGLVKNKWSMERLNGRQIRNAMRTALVVAEQKGVVVGDDEVGVVLRIGREFEGYMKTIGRAQKEGIEGFEEVMSP